VHTLLTVIRKKPEIETAEFRRFMKDDYGPTYQALPQTRAYIQYFLSDLAIDDAEDPIDAIVQISYMRETSVGIHSAVVEETNQLV
jgi:hypothetical protein